MPFLAHLVELPRLIIDKRNFPCLYNLHSLRSGYKRNSPHNLHDARRRFRQ